MGLGRSWKSACRELKIGNKKEESCPTWVCSKAWTPIIHISVSNLTSKNKVLWYVKIRYSTFYEPNFKLAIRQGNTIAPICSQYHANKIFSQIFKYNLLSSPTGSFTFFTVSKYYSNTRPNLSQFFEPQNPEIDKFYGALGTGSPDFEALKLWNVWSGIVRKLDGFRSSKDVKGSVGSCIKRRIPKI